jgi:hypothetical protein
MSRETFNAGDLLPVDPTRCQAEKSTGSFMTFGPRKLERCTSKPTWIGIEVKDGQFYGAMSLCDDCKRVCEIQMPTVSFQRLEVE